MSPLISMLVIPLLLLTVIWSVRHTQTMTKLASILFWGQFLQLVYVLYPVLSGNIPVLFLAQEFLISRLGAFFAILTQLVAACSMTHAHLFFMQDDAHKSEDRTQLRVFYTCSTLFLLAMTSVFFCDNLGFLWVSVEATTLCSAPLVYFHRNKHALEAAWKYLMICSVGIAFALFGTMFIFASSQQGAIPDGSLDLQTLQAHSKQLQYPLLRLGFLFCLLGYGTKAGIFPLHSWLPDAHSESPAPASAMLSGGLLNCALFAIWRIAELLTASGHKSLIENTAIPAGVLTVLVASIFLIRQHGIKRLFAYSSIENVGLMVAAIGLGSGPLFFLLGLNHSIAKVALFLMAGNIIQSVGTKAINGIQGLLTANPVWSLILLMGTFAVTGAPPFGAFAAEWILLVMFAERHMWLVVTVLLLSISLGFIAATMHVGRMLCGAPKENLHSMPVLVSSVVPALLLLLTFLCGVSSVARIIGEIK